MLEYNIWKEKDYISPIANWLNSWTQHCHILILNGHNRRRHYISHFLKCSRMQRRCVQVVSYLNNDFRQKESPSNMSQFWFVDTHEENFLHCHFLIFNTLCIRVTGSGFVCFSWKVEIRLHGVMPQSFLDQAHLWYLHDKSSKVHIYATWSKVRKRQSKVNLLFENTPLSKCGRKVLERAKPVGHGELASCSFSCPLLLMLTDFYELSFPCLDCICIWDKTTRRHVY